MDSTQENMSKPVREFAEDSLMREFKVYTGFQGMLEFDSTLRKEITRGSLRHLADCGYIDLEEFTSLMSMIEASQADYVLAELIIEQKANEFNI